MLGIVQLNNVGYYVLSPLGEKFLASKVMNTLLKEVD
jgi:hypothetical protein